MTLVVAGTNTAREATARMGIAPVREPGECFRSSFEAVMLAAEDGGSAVLCHSLSLQLDGTVIAHGHVEDRRTGEWIAIDTTWAIARPAEEYRRLLRLFHILTYTPAEAVALMESTDSLPWDAAVREGTSHGVLSPEILHGALLRGTLSETIIRRPELRQALTEAARDLKVKQAEWNTNNEREKNT
jgi:hypothetical protein